MQLKVKFWMQLPEPLTGKTVSLDESKGAKATLVMFICNHCPFVSSLTFPLAKFPYQSTSTRAFNKGLLLHYSVMAQLHNLS